MIKKTITIHFQCVDDLPEDNCCAFITEGEFSPMLVSANSIGEAVIEMGKSIQVAELYKKQRHENGNNLEANRQRSA